MYDNNNQNTQETVMAAKVAAELFHARQLTRSLSISSKNLRVLAKRIGQNAAGLAILASFYEDRKSTRLNSTPYLISFSPFFF